MSKNLQDRIGDPLYFKSPLYCAFRLKKNVTNGIFNLLPIIGNC